MNYQQALEYLASLGKFGINLGLMRIEKLLAAMGHPERNFKTVHVTGTNGKGSTTAMIAAALTAAGIKTAMYTSPHLVSYTERMVINGKQVSEHEFARAIEYTSKFVAAMTADGYEHPTEFEVLTAAAFYCFAAANVEYAVIEVGLGGLLDSTNVITPEVAVITNVTLEHTDRCGQTIPEIAYHKAGIIKTGVPTVTAAKGAALDVITSTAKAKHSRLYLLGRDFTAQYRGIAEYKQQVVFSLPDQQPELLLSSLLGRHQAENCALARMALKLLAEKDARITTEAVNTGFSEVYWPARFEIIPGRPLVVIDGGHNPDGARVLRQTLDEVFPGRKITFLLGILRDKDVAGMVKTLIRPADRVVAVRPLSERAAEAEEVAALVRQRGAERVEAAASIEEGLAAAKASAGDKGLVCVAGSLYLAGAAWQLVHMDK